MYALTFQGKKTISLQKVADPEIISSDDAIVKVALTAICGSDLHVYHGREAGLDIGTTMGHEFIGEVVAIGRNVKNFRCGDPVFSPFFSACGQCSYCQKSLSCRCKHGHLFGWLENGEGLQGAQAEYVRVPFADSTLHKIPEGVSAEEALLLCDILPTGFFCADMANVTPGKSYAVIGCGPVGLQTILGLKILGADQIFAIDMLPERLAIAQEFGANIFDGKTDVKASILEITGGRGVDGVCEVVGNLSAQQLAYDIVRPGGTLSVVGVHNSAHFAFSPTDLYNKNLTYKTGRCPVQRYLPMLIPVVQQKKYDFTRIISHRLSLSEGVRGYRIFDEKLEKCTKVILYCKRA